MILGLIAGGVLEARLDGRGPRSLWLVVAGGISLALGWGAGRARASARWSSGSGRRAGSSSRGGFCFLFLAAFYAVIDVLGWGGWAFPLRVIGMNSIAAYCLSHLIEDFIADSFRTHLGRDVFKVLGQAYEPFLQGAAVLLVLWLILFWMYRRKLFLKI